MGLFTRCWLGEVCLVKTRDDLDGEVSSLFSEGDKHIVPAANAASAPRVVRETWARELEHDLNELVFYVMPASVARDDLEMMGYTVETSALAFAAGLQSERRASERHAEQYPGLERIRLSERAWALERWLAHWKGEEELEQELEELPFSEYRVAGFPGPDGLPGLRLLLEEADADTQLVYDVTDLVWQDCCAATDDVLTWNMLDLDGDDEDSGGTIVLTEGKSDSWILEGALRLLYPRFAKEFSFMDFGSFRAEGGAPMLVKLLRSFAAAHVANRVIALFDNDTAAHDALRGLNIASLPPRFRVLTLGETDLLRCYPTIGPTGPERMDVNGLAGGIELYLGRDILEVEGELSPVQWRGFVQGMNRYQGEVLNKEAITKAFKAKLNATSSGNISNPAWVELRVVINQLLTAFHELDRELILQRIRRYGERSR